MSLEVRNLSKKYGEKTVVENLTGPVFLRFWGQTEPERPLLSV